MHRPVTIVVLVTALSWLPSASIAAQGGADAAPAAVAPREFAWKSVAEPENLFWPGYFWYWNGPLKPDVLRRQLADMASHDARSVCTIAMPHEFRPDVTNSLMDVDYLSPQFFDRVKIAVDEAARRGMNYWIYDEGGWPSGHAAGRVIRKNPDARIHVLACNAAGKWTPGTEGAADLLNRQATQTFISLTHERYRASVGSEFGKSIKLVFTDEPGYRPAAPGSVIPWPIGAKDHFQRWFGYDVLQKLDAFRVTDVKQLSESQKKVRADLFDFWSRRFRDNYFLPLRDWSRQHGLAHGGHLGGDDETFGAVTYGYGHIMRPLRAMDVPGVDTIWRQIWPNKANHHFPKFASSAAHQNGTALAFTESFAVYGNGLTPSQMKWMVDYQFVRGLTLLVGCKYPVCTTDHMMTDERPNFGTVDPLWDFLPHFHRYVARLGYVLACGKPAIDTALYYPVRDIWASGDPADPALRGHNALAQVLLQRQCDFDIVDDDVLGDPDATVEGKRLKIGAMGYRTIVVGPTRWMTDAAKKKLDEFQSAGGKVVHATDLASLEAAIADIAPTVRLAPQSSDLRVARRSWAGGGAAFFFNEGTKPYKGVALAKPGERLYELDPATGVVRAIARPDKTDSGVPLQLAAGESMLVLRSDAEPSELAGPIAGKTLRSIELADGWTAGVRRQYKVGQHDYEVQSFDPPEFKPVALGPWAKSLKLGEDFSGHVVYRRTIQVPNQWGKGRLLLDLGNVEYAADVSVDGRRVGSVLWSPWRIELPLKEDQFEFVLEIAVGNTLANELTSQRVRDAWSKRKGPGWPSIYHKQALGFEMDSRGGGLLGPVRLELAAP